MGAGLHPNRPKTFARNPTIPKEVADVSIYAGQAQYPCRALRRRLQALLEAATRAYHASGLISGT